MDTLSIEKLKTDTVIGIHDWERQIKQTIYFDVQCTIDASQPAKTDNITDALDYSALCSALQSFVESSTFFLIETLAEKSAEFLFSYFKMDQLTLKLTKPGAIPNAQHVSITIERCFNNDRRPCNGHDNSK